MINEKLGIAEASTYYADVITMRVFSLLEEFESKDPKPDKSEKDYKIRFTYSDIKGFITNWEKYKKFPVSEIKLNLKIKCCKTIVGKEDIVITALSYPYAIGNETEASRFKKPTKKSIDHSLSLYMDMEVEYIKIVFDKGEKYVSNYIKAGVLHELTHFYEDYTRRIKGASPFKYAIAASVGDNTHRVPGKIWRYWNNNFALFVYKAEPHEINAYIQEGLPQIKEMGIEGFKNTRIWKEAMQMKDFDAEKFIDKMNELAVSRKEEYNVVLLEKLKNDFIKDYEKTSKEFRESPRYNIENLKKLSTLEFFKFWEKIINRAGEKLIRGYYRLVSYEESVAVKKFREFLNENRNNDIVAYRFSDSYHQLNLACLKYKLLGYHLNDDMSINMFSDVDLSNKNLEYIPILFHLVKGDFNCSNNKLISIDGGPVVVDNFNCNNNLLKTLQGSPEIINGNYDCSNNQLKFISGGPSSIKGYFNFSNNQVMYIGEFPKVSKEITYSGNPIEEILNLFPKEDINEICSEIKEYGIMWPDGNTWLVSRMFLEEMSKDICGKIVEIPSSFKNYKIVE